MKHFYNCSFLLAIVAIVIALSMWFRYQHVSYNNNSQFGDVSYAINKEGIASTDSECVKSGNCYYTEGSDCGTGNDYFDLGIRRKEEDGKFYRLCKLRNPK